MDVYFCNSCRQPTPCNCDQQNYQCAPPCPPGVACEEYTDAECVVYHYNNPDDIPNLTCLGIPNGGTLEAFMEAVSSRLCGLDGADVTYLYNTYGVTNFTQFVTAVNQELFDLRTLVNYILGSCCLGSTTAPASTTIPLISTTNPLVSTTVAPSTTAAPVCNAVTGIIASITGQNLSFAFSPAVPVPAVNYAFELIRINLDLSETVITSGTLPNTYSGVVTVVNLGTTINPSPGISYIFRVVSNCGFGTATAQTNVNNNNTTTTQTPCLSPINVSVVIISATTTVPITTSTTGTTTVTTTVSPNIFLRAVWGMSGFTGSIFVDNTSGPGEMTAVLATHLQPTTFWSLIDAPGTYSFSVDITINNQLTNYIISLTNNAQEIFTYATSGSGTIAVTGMVLSPSDQLEMRIDPL